MPRPKRKCRGRSRKKAEEEIEQKERSQEHTPRKRKLSDSSSHTPPSKRARRDESESPTKLLAKDLENLTVSKKDEKRLESIQKALLTTEVREGVLKGREKEYEKIKDFLDTCRKKKQGDSLYICGSPGTGKSATLLSIENMLAKERRPLQVIQINAMSLRTPNSIYTVLYQELFANKEKISPQQAVQHLRKELTRKRGKMRVVIVDEMDGLLEKHGTVLYQLFEMCKAQDSKLILIGIANSIDLTDRFLPRLRARKIHPQLLIFEPYSKEELVTILTDRLSTDEDSYFHPFAIQLCAQKIAKESGDVRKALQVCRCALNEVLNGEIDEIGLKEMKAVLKASFTSPQVEIIQSLPNRQKIVVVLIALLSRDKKAHTKVTLHALKTFYHWMESKHGLPKTSGQEVTMIVDRLVADGIVSRLSKSKQKLTAESEFTFTVPFEDVKLAVENHHLLALFVTQKFVVPSRFV